MEESANRPPSWLPWLGLVICGIGIAAASYLTYAHYTTPLSLACPETGVINCAKVTTSTYSSILGIPLAVLGLLFFVAMVPLQLPVAWRSRWKLLRLGRLVFAASGILMIFWLLYVELFKLNAICLYCSAVHVLTLLLFGLTAAGTALTVEE